MKIAITHPFCWPYVRRGAERFMAELGGFLASRGHEVISISSKPGSGITERNPAGARILHRQWWTPAMAKLRLQPAHGFLIPCLASINRLKPDLVQSLYYVDAWASEHAGSRHKTVYYVTGPPIPVMQRRIPPDRWLLRRAIEDADELLVPSKFIQNLVETYYGRTARIMPVPIDAAAFARTKCASRSRAILLAVAAFDERRKGLRVLLRAFERLCRHRPDAILRISGTVSEDVRKQALELVPPKIRESVAFLGTGCLEDLPILYSEASVTILPAIWESFSLVALESWASGTPVVAANHSALPELVDDDSIGVLFDPGTDPHEPNADDTLAEAIEKGLALGDLPGTAEKCRSRAARYSWSELGTSFERFYLDLLS
jgi:phosphatidyl-myo-inositol alpha-mannosyltransferase